MAKIDGEPLRILVVEDDSPIAQMIASILTDEGHIEKIETQEYDLILSDLRMPELDGVGLYRELKRRHSHLLRRMIVITGTSAHPEYESFLTETRVPFLEKPFGLTALHELVRQVMSAV